MERNFTSIAALSLRRNRLAGTVPLFLFALPIVALDLGEVRARVRACVRARARVCVCVCGCV